MEETIHCEIAVEAESLEKNTMQSPTLALALTSKHINENKKNAYEKFSGRYL